MGDVALAAPTRVAKVRKSGGGSKATRGELRYQVRDADSDQLIPAKLTLIGVEGSRSPRLGPRAGRRDGEAFVAFNRAFSAAGEGVLTVPFGTYDIFVSQGPEWTLHRERVVITSAGATLQARLRRVVATPGWISADLHVHSAWSRDSVVDPRARMQQFLADGVEVIVAAEHNVVADYSDIIASAGANHLLKSLPGIEMTSRSWGHLSVFPLPRSEVGKRTLVDLIKKRATAATMFAKVREIEPDAIITVCHPHIITSSYFIDGELNLHSGRSKRAGFSFDFDAVEIINGYHNFSFGRSVDRNLSKWFRLIGHGHRLTATAGSDSHELRAVHGQGGVPRSYIWVGDDHPESIEPRAFARAIKNQRLLYTTGPFVELKISGKTIGDTVTVTDGHVELEISVTAAPWVPVDKLRVYANGRVVSMVRVPASVEVARFSHHHRLDLDRDTHIVVRVDGKTMLPLVGEAKQTVPALAITNPIYIDVDGNGRYDPPAKKRARRK